VQSNRYVVVAAVIAAAVGLAGGWWAAQSRDQDHMSQYARLGAEIGCQCATCPLRPIATCGCAFADGMLAELSAMTDGSQSDAQIMATFAGRYSPSVRIKPAGSGLALLVWVAPMLLLTVGGVGVGAVLSRWAASRETGANPDFAVEKLDPARRDTVEARAIVERELADLGN